VEGFGKVREDLGFFLVGYVVMPNHVHLLMSEPKKGTPSTVLQMLKQRVSKRVRKKNNPVPREKQVKSLPEFVGELPRFWQERFYDLNVYSSKKQKEKLDYMHVNPVARGLVKHPKEWPWSSWGFYFQVEPVLIAMDVVDL